MTDMAPGWHPDPDGLDQLRWWDGDHWTDDTQPAPAPPKSVRFEGSTRTRDARDGTTSDGPEFPEPVFPNRTPRRILWGVVALGVIMLVLAVAVTALSNSGSKSDSASNSDADVAADDTTPDTKADPELKPPDSSLPTTSIASTGGGVFTESNHLYQITAGPDWHLATSGLSATPLWTIGAATNADASIVNIVAGTVPQGTTTQQFAEQTLAGIEGVAGLTLTSPAPIPTTLTDGTPAAIITNDYVVSGVKRSQELLVAVNGTTAVTITVSSPPEQAQSTFRDADPYIRSLVIF